MWNSVGSTAATAPIQSGGSGYAIGDTITLTGGIFTRAVLVTVATLSGSAVATVTLTDGGAYSTIPTNPISQGATSGLGSGATFNLTWSTTGLISNLSGAAIWPSLGSTTYMSGAMSVQNGLGLANYIGATNLAAAVITALPVPTPSGYLTLSSSLTQPILTTDATSATVLYYTPLNGVWTAINNGTTIIPYALSGQLSLTLTTAQVSNNIYDVYLAYNGGTPVIGVGPTWSAGTGGSITVGSCARGTGAGGAALTKSLGWLVNAASMSLVYNTGAGNNTITVAANQGIYLGTINIDSTAGQITCNRTFGQSRRWNVWNAYNRQPIYLKSGDNTSSWTIVQAAYRALNSNSANSFTFFQGLQEEPLSVLYQCSVPTQNVASGSQFDISCGIGYNSTTSPIAASTTVSVISAASALAATVFTKYNNIPTLGTNVITMLEASSNTFSMTVSGTEANTCMVGTWRG